MAEKIAGPLGITVEEAALSVKETIDANMGKELLKVRNRLSSTESPLLVVYGGAGPAHCCDTAKAAGIGKIVITPFSAVFSAYSSSGMDVGHIYYARTDMALNEGSDFSSLSQKLEGLQKEAERDMRGEGFTPEDMKFTLELFVQKDGDDAEAKLDAPYDFFRSPEGVQKVFQEARGLLGQNGEGSSDALKLNMVGLVVQAEVPHFEVSEMPVSKEDATVAKKSARSVFLNREKGFQEIPVYDRSRLSHGHHLSGPALVESEQTTILVSSGWSMSVDQYNNAVLEEVNAS